jgi:hypothetical protein
LTIRLSSYLCSLIHSFSIEEAEKIERECEFLQALFPDRLRAFEVVREVLKYLCHLDLASRRQKLGLLQKLDTPEKRPEVIVIRWGDAGKGEAHIRIEPTANYATVVMASIERLRMAVQTGSILTSVEEGQKRAEWNRDVRFIQELGQNSVAAKAREAEWYHRDDSENLVDALKPHIQQLLDAGSRVAPQHRGQLQVGYHIDAISAALVKLKRWDEGRYWLELFFGLDPEYQAGPKSDREKMRRRLERCKAEVTKMV